jgi:hypothetical protein
MKMRYWTTLVLLLSGSLLGCQKNERTQVLSKENPPNLSIVSENKCEVLAQLSFGEEVMRHYSLMGQNDFEKEGILEIEFTWTDGTNEQRFDCTFKPKMS